MLTQLQSIDGLGKKRSYYSGFFLPTHSLIIITILKPHTLTQFMLGFLSPQGVANFNFVKINNWASLSEPHTSVFNGEFVCAYGVRTYAHTAYHFAFQYNVSNSFRNIPNCSRGHGGCSAASLGMLSQSRRQRQRLQRCRIYPQVGGKSHWNSRERVLEPEELSFLQATDSDTETREEAKELLRVRRR